MGIHPFWGASLPEAISKSSPPGLGVICYADDKLVTARGGELPKGGAPGHKGAGLTGGPEQDGG